MHFSKGNNLISFLQLQSTAVTIIIMMFFGEAVGQSRLTRMPTFYGKRSGDSKTSRTSPSFGLGRFESLLPSSSSSSSSSSSNHMTNNMNDLDLSRKASFMKLLSGENGLSTLSGEELSLLKKYMYDLDGELQEKRTLGTRQLDEKEKILDTIRDISEYNNVLEKMIDSNRRIQDDLLGEFTDEADDLPTRSRDVGAVVSARVHAAPSVKRGILSRLPQFYGRKK